MRVIALSTLREYWERHADVEGALRDWYRIARHSEWKTPEDIRAVYRTASIIGGDRVVFNIKGNQYRLIVAVNYERGIIYIRFIGSHREYDKVDAASI